MTDIRLRPIDPTAPEARELIAELDAYQTALYHPISVYLMPAEALAAAGAVFLAADLAGRLVGCCGLVNYGDYGELKRLYVRPEGRGLGVANRLAQALEAQALAWGLRLMRVETGVAQPEAQALFGRLGYTRRGTYGDYVEDGLSVFLEKMLA